MTAVVETTAPEPEPIGPDDFALDPMEDLEEQCVCALLWAHPADGAKVTAHLRGEDFHLPIYRELFEVIAALAGEGAPHTAAMVAARLEQDGRLGGHAGERLRRALVGATTVGADGASVGFYARAVASAAYRRSFRDVGLAIAEAAETLPEHELFEHMVDLGRRQRAATVRLAALRAAGL
ncbi:DnaB-like helicase N-terminal domain-containing protein [Rhodococcus sp. RDE2]|uniref:DnaB-like helicase N-terminal domain-containing protein n=1 Tax=Rhodococcus sp. RDE2 TaxID=2885078 RepID=UPI001E3ED32F|nr:DnaB-like helicase N-terminal domain-containing protein [Rhodococcus sp. RDE2]BDB63529.1 hypothetical protein RDE2_53230 [Rhodococcus sp. RDE2]